MLPEIGSIMDRSPAAVGLERITDQNLKAVCAAIGPLALEHLRDTLGDILRFVILDGEQQGP
jgi:hypothetical protein